MVRDVEQRYVYEAQSRGRDDNNTWPQREGSPTAPPSLAWPALS